MANPGDKAASFLSSLRGAAAPKAQSPEAAVANQAAAALQRRVEELEQRLGEVAKVVEPPGEGEPPRPPTELMLYLQTRMDLLEGKLRASEEEALKANLLLREREEAQRRAQKEVEDLFRSIREQSRAASWDAALREKFSASQARVTELEARLKDLERGSVPAAEVVRLINEEEGRKELLRRIQEKAAAVAAAAAPESVAAPIPPAAPVPPVLEPPPGGADSRTVSVLMGRVADLERRLEETQKERDQERARRLLWEKDIFSAVAKEGERWRRTGGAKVVVEASLQNIAQAMRERDALTAELAKLLDADQDPTLDPAQRSQIRARRLQAQDQIERLKKDLDKNMALVQAWLLEGKNQGESR